MTDNFHYQVHTREYNGEPDPLSEVSVSLDVLPSMATDECPALEFRKLVIEALRGPWSDRGFVHIRGVCPEILSKHEVGCPCHAVAIQTQGRADHSTWDDLPDIVIHGWRIA